MSKLSTVVITALPALATASIAVANTSDTTLEEKSLLVLGVCWTTPLVVFNGGWYHINWC